MKKMQSGFTLIELVMVIVILGILAASALPKFVDLSTDAQDAANEGMAGALSSASSINYAARLVRGSTQVAVTAGCADGYSLVDGYNSTDYPVSSGTFGGGDPNGTVLNCTVQDLGTVGAAASWQIIRAD